MEKSERRQKILAAARRLKPPQQAQLFRAAVSGGEKDQHLLLDLADLAAGSNPDDTALPKYRAALMAGRRVKISSYPIKFLTFDGVDANLVYAIEEAFRGESE